MIERRLRATAPDGDPHRAWIAGLEPAATRELRSHLPTTLARAAVLVPLVERAAGLTVLLTQRASHLKHHPGQISFPGGRIESDDANPWEAAVREAEEEIGLAREHVSLAGYLDDHLVISGYVVTPAVGFVRPGFELRLDTTEVEAAFEVPLDFVLDPANHVASTRVFAGRAYTTHDIPYGERHIWGATAGMLLSLGRALEGG
jgi:8-oxo-dGTP pyrophosphatase MutT (NUDIX family)